MEQVELQEKTLKETDVINREEQQQQQQNSENIQDIKDKPQKLQQQQLQQQQQPSNIQNSKIVIERPNQTIRYVTLENIQLNQDDFGYESDNEGYFEKLAGVDSTQLFNQDHSSIKYNNIQGESQKSLKSKQQLENKDDKKYEDKGQEQKNDQNQEQKKDEENQPQIVNKKEMKIITNFLRMNRTHRVYKDQKEMKEYIQEMSLKNQTNNYKFSHAILSINIQSMVRSCKRKNPKHYYLNTENEDLIKSKSFQNDRQKKKKIEKKKNPSLFGGMLCGLILFLILGFITFWVQFGYMVSNDYMEGDDYFKVKNQEKMENFMQDGYDSDEKQATDRMAKYLHSALPTHMDLIFIFFELFLGNILFGGPIKMGKGRFIVMSFLFCKDVFILVAALINENLDMDGWKFESGFSQWGYLFSRTICSIPCLVAILNIFHLRIPYFIIRHKFSKYNLRRHKPLNHIKNLNNKQEYLKFKQEKFELLQNYYKQNKENNVQTKYQQFLTSNAYIFHVIWKTIDQNYKRQKFWGIFQMVLFIPLLLVIAHFFLGFMFLFQILVAYYGIIIIWVMSMGFHIEIAQQKGFEIKIHKRNIGILTLLTKQYDFKLEQSKKENLSQLNFDLNQRSSYLQLNDLQTVQSSYFKSTKKSFVALTEQNLNQQNKFSFLIDSISGFQAIGVCKQNEAQQIGYDYDSLKVLQSSIFIQSDGQFNQQNKDHSSSIINFQKGTKIYGEYQKDTKKLIFHTKNLFKSGIQQLYDCQFLKTPYLNKEDNKISQNPMIQAQQNPENLQKLYEYEYKVIYKYRCEAKQDDVEVHFYKLIACRGWMPSHVYNEKQELIPVVDLDWEFENPPIYYEFENIDDPSQYKIAVALQNPLDQIYISNDFLDLETTLLHELEKFYCKSNFFRYYQDVSTFNTYFGFLVLFSMFVQYASICLDGVSWVAISTLFFTSPIQTSVNMFAYNEDEILAFIIKCVFAF